MNAPGTIVRYADRTRMRHWFVTLLFFCAGLTGLAFFHPFFFPLVNLFGGGVWSRILHPFFGVLMVLGFLGMFFVMWRDNVLDAGDRAWFRAAPQLMRGEDVAMPPVAKYNAGQKLVFWSVAGNLVVLLLTGIVFWQPWFAPWFPALALRLAVVLHALAAVLLILTIIIHIYAAIWTRGSLQAMTRGTVPAAWARHHHPLWWQRMTGK